ncbi:MAG: amidohydrolase [Deltaproteobacteria bacterium]|nr:amidohydrolase [Deltaproteobacteria bacterium]
MKRRSPLEKLPVIDVWAQPALIEGLKKIPEVMRLFEQSGSSALLKRGLNTEETLALMDQAGISKLMLAAWSRPGTWIFSNEQIAEMVQAHPDRFSGVASVNLENPVQAVKELEHAVKEWSFKALRIVPWLWKLPPNDKLYYPLYVKCIELEIPFCTQAGHTGPLMPSETGRPVPYLDEVALTFPDLKIVAGHIGYPWTQEMIGLAWKHPNVFIDTSAYLPRYYPQELIHFMKTYGQDKVLFGTNFPQLPFDKAVKQVEDLDLSQEVKEKFLFKNAKRIFKV